MDPIAPPPLAPLAVLIPALNEAQRLPALLADLQQAPPGLLRETLVVDGGSGDGTAALARLAGAQLLHSPRGRGSQLALAAARTSAPWLLVLHADVRLPQGWTTAIAAAMAQPAAAWSFNLAIDAPGLPLRLLELAVALRSRLGQCPYGDQGLLLPRQLYAAAGGFAPIPLMEDLDLVQRLQPHTRLRCLRQPLRVDGRRWRERGVLAVAWRNWQLRRAWRRGANTADLARRYYGEYQKAQRFCWGSSSQPWAL
jgi:rSAM/selenodomain-associated transferase 2